MAWHFALLMSSFSFFIWKRKTAKVLKNKRLVKMGYTPFVWTTLVRITLKQIYVIPTWCEVKGWMGGMTMEKLQKLVKTKGLKVLNLKDFTAFHRFYKTIDHYPIFRKNYPLPGFLILCISYRNDIELSKLFPENTL